jgi:hypothetical protein
MKAYFPLVGLLIHAAFGKQDQSNSTLNEGWKNFLNHPSQFQIQLGNTTNKIINASLLNNGKLTIGFNSLEKGKIVFNKIVGKLDPSNNLFKGILNFQLPKEKKLFHNIQFTFSNSSQANGKVNGDSISSLIFEKQA